MVQERLVNKAVSVLLIAGFACSERCNIRPRSFDLVAKRADLLLIIKVASPIDNVSEEIARDLDLVAVHLGGMPLIVGERGRDTELERGAVYLRYGIAALNPETLFDYFVEGVPPLVYASPGGLYVNINGDMLRSLRERRTLSLGDLAHALGVSRRTISKYEAGMGTTLDMAIKLEEFFNAEVIESIDLLSYASHFKGANSPAAPGTDSAAMSALMRLGLELHHLRRAPFQAMAHYEEQTILAGCGSAQKVMKRAGLIGNLSEITRTHAVCVTDEEVRQKRIGRTLLIGPRALGRLEDGGELLELIG
ncbi:MAG: transcriptional regulator [Methanospirillum sp.]|nr:transcriptional regulator [Methanospirillum sp.]